MVLARSARGVTGGSGSMCQVTRDAECVRAFSRFPSVQAAFDRQSASPVTRVASSRGSARPASDLISAEFVGPSCALSGECPSALALRRGGGPGVHPAVSRNPHSSGLSGADAEVAFVVEGPYQGHGIATALLPTPLPPTARCSMSSCTRHGQ
jgi:hypothetical protein